MYFVLDQVANIVILFSPKTVYITDIYFTYLLCLLQSKSVHISSRRESFIMEKCSSKYNKILKSFK